MEAAHGRPSAQRRGPGHRHHASTRCAERRVGRSRDEVRHRSGLPYSVNARPRRARSRRLRRAARRRRGPRAGRLTASGVPHPRCWPAIRSRQIAGTASVILRATKRSGERRDPLLEALRGCGFPTGGPRPGILRIARHAGGRGASDTSVSTLGPTHQRHTATKATSPVAVTATRQTCSGPELVAPSRVLPPISR